MNGIFIVGFLITLLTILAFNVNFYIFIALGLLFIIISNIMLKKINFFIIIIPLLFMLRIGISFDFNKINVGENIKITTTIHNGKGKIDSINDKIPNTISYINLKNLNDGKYMVFGKVNKINNIYGYNFYKIYSKDIIEEPQNKINLYFDKISNRLIKNEKEELKDLYKAVILGKNYNIERYIKEIFSYIGISHIIALSGLHIGLIILIIGGLLSLLPIQKRPRYIMFAIILTLYYLGIKHSPSLTRAYIMGILFLISIILYEGYKPKSALTLAYIIELFIDPTNFLTLSFKLSFIAVFIILWIFPLIKKIIYRKKNKFIDALILVLVIQIFMLPVLIIELGQIQCLCFISNIILIPIASIFTGLCFVALLLENIFLGKIILPFIKVLYEIFMFLVYKFNEIEYMSIYIDAKRNNYFYILYFILIFLIIKILEKKCQNLKKHEKIIRIL